MELRTVVWQLPSGAEFEWDPAKANANLRDHKVPFLKACEVFKDAKRLESPDPSNDYDKERWNVLGLVDQAVLFVVYTLRGERIRMISARKATRNEQRIYWFGDTP